MIILKRKEFGDRLDPISSTGYNVNKKEDDEDFEKELGRRIKRDKIDRRIIRTVLPGTIGGLIGCATKTKRARNAALGALAGSGLGYGVGEIYDKITKYDEKQKKAKEDAIEEYKSEEHKGHKGIDKRKRLREKYLDKQDITPLHKKNNK